MYPNDVPKQNNMKDMIHVDGHSSRADEIVCFNYKHHWKVKARTKII